MRVIIALAVALILAATTAPLARAESPRAARFPTTDNDDAWNQLPREKPPLPAWALVLVQSLPRTTGGMLELDYLHRAKNPLGPVLAGKLRWAAADAIGCAYAKRYAEADLKRAKLKDDDLKKLAADPPDLPEAERAALRFARKMSLAAETVTDAEVAELLKLYGPAKLVAMAHTLAFANHQYRIFLALGVEIEAKGPLKPFDPGLDLEQRGKVTAPTRPPWEDVAKAAATDIMTRPAWRDLTFDEVEKALELQRTRKSRIPLPDQTLLEHLPPAERGQASRIVWSNISMGYQPELTRAWFQCMQAFQQEAKLNRTFTGSVFWIVTRSNECFY